MKTLNELVRALLVPSQVRRRFGLVTMTAMLMTVCGTNAWSQDTFVTLLGKITATATTGVNVGDSYTLTMSYNPTQAPASTGTDTAFYNTFTLSIIVFDSSGNQTFGTLAGEQLIVHDAPAGNPNHNGFNTTGTDTGFQLLDSTGLFKSTALPTSLTLADFNSTAIVIGPFDGFQGNITSIQVINTDVMTAFVSAGLVDPNKKIPTLNGVPGAGVNNLDIAMPLTALTHGTSYTYTVALQDQGFTGTCEASYKLTQVQAGTTVTLDSVTPHSFACAPGDTFAWAWVGKAIPDSPGPATLTGIVTYGSRKATSSTTLLFQ
jgi:hypothetical protein